MSIMINFFCIPNYCKPITFESDGFLVNTDRKEELDQEHGNTDVDDIDNNISIEDLLVNDA